MAGLRAAHLRRNGEQSGTRKSEKTEADPPGGLCLAGSPFLPHADYSPVLLYTELHNRTGAGLLFPSLSGEFEEPDAQGARPISNCPASNSLPAQEVINFSLSFTHPSAAPAGDGFLCKQMNARLCRRLNHGRRKSFISQYRLSRMAA